MSSKRVASSRKQRVSRHPQLAHSQPPQQPFANQAVAHPALTSFNMVVPRVATKSSRTRVDGAGDSHVARDVIYGTDADTQHVALNEQQRVAQQQQQQVTQMQHNPHSAFAGLANPLQYLTAAYGQSHFPMNPAASLLLSLQQQQQQQQQQQPQQPRQPQQPHQQPLHNEELTPQQRLFQMLQEQSAMNKHSTDSFTPVEEKRLEYTQVKPLSRVRGKIDKKGKDNTTEAEKYGNGTAGALKKSKSRYKRHEHERNMYFERVLKGTPPGLLSKAEKWISRKIIETDALLDSSAIDWNSMEMPDFVLRDGKDDGLSVESSGTLITSSGNNAPQGISYDLDDDSFVAPKSYSKKAVGVNKVSSMDPIDFSSQHSSIVDRIGTVRKSTRAAKRNASSVEESEMNEEWQRREQRRMRFINDKKEEERKRREAERVALLAAEEVLMSGGNMDSSVDVIDWDEDTVVGTSGQLEKRYLRLTSAPDPSTVRPLHILRKTLALLKEKWEKERNYTYLCDQLKSARQDLTVQRIKNAFTVELYEFHARVAIEMGDMGEFNQCQGQLQYFYALGLEGCVDEFFGYRILYMVYTQNRPELIHMMNDVTDELKESEHVKLSLAIRSSVSSNDFYSFFKLRKLANNSLAGKLIDQFINKERVKALTIICKVYRPSISLSYISNILAFSTEKQCRKWINQYEGIQWTVKNKELDCKLSHQVFVDAFQSMCASGIDIKGQIH